MGLYQEMLNFSFKPYMYIMFPQILALDETWILYAEFN